MTLPAVLVDTFHDANGTGLASHTGESNASWTKHPSFSGVLSINSNRVHNDNSGNAGQYYASLPSIADCSAIFECYSETLNGDFWVAVRMDPASNTCYRVRYIASTTTWAFEKVVSGTVTTLDNLVSSTQVAIPGSFFILIWCKGSTLKCILTMPNNSSQIFGRREVDSAIASGRIGFGFGNTGSSTTGWQLVSVRAVPVLCFDTFTDADGTSLTAHTMDSGATWLQVNGSLNNATIHSNRVCGGSDTGAGSHYVASTVPNGKNMLIDYGWHCVSNTAYIVGQLRSDPNSAVSAELRYSNGIAYQIIQHGTGSGDQQIGSNFSFTATVGHDYETAFLVLDNVYYAFHWDITGGSTALTNIYINAMGNFIPSKGSVGLGFYQTASTSQGYQGNRYLAFDLDPALNPSSSSGGTVAVSF